MEPVERADGAVRALVCRAVPSHGALEHHQFGAGPGAHQRRCGRDHPGAVPRAALVHARRARLLASDVQLPVRAVAARAGAGAGAARVASRGGRSLADATLPTRHDSLPERQPVGRGPELWLRVLPSARHAAVAHARHPRAHRLRARRHWRRCYGALLQRHRWRPHLRPVRAHARATRVRLADCVHLRLASRRTASAAAAGVCAARVHRQPAVGRACAATRRAATCERGGQSSTAPGRRRRR